MKFGKHIKKLRVPEDCRVKLSQWATRIEPLYKNDDDYKCHLEDFKTELRAFQEKFYASDERAVLLVFQGMDTAGKDGAISHVVSGVNPQGCFVRSFKVPNDEELKHDFLWRTHRQMPGRGEIGIFNRSYYEEILVTRVHSQVLAHEKLPKSAMQIKHFWRTRLEDIRNHEAYLAHQGVQILKFFLHISKDEQRDRLISRIKEPKKNWKISRGDFEERKYWNEYVRAYEACFSGTSTRQNPWFIIPADDKQNARLLISQILMEELKSRPVSYPRVTAKQLRQLKAMKKTL
jgi:PPK2 family polyphosphate:nucleotide phosphotransferase